MTTRSSEADGVEQVILPPVRDLGDGFTVRRALPSPQRRMVGPFIFFDQMGPVVFDAGEGLDVRPHPHIGLATVSYLLRGEMLHRDSVGSVQTILPGEVNWMTAGRGIVHSERTGPETRAAGGPLFGLQTWVALPADQEEAAPGFVHHAAAAIPSAAAGDVALTVIAGEAEGLRSPVAVASPMIYMDIRLADRARYRLPQEHVERAIYVIEGAVGVFGQFGTFAAGTFVVLKPGAEIVVEAAGPTRLMLAGGEPLAEQRHIQWNFVSSRPDRIEQAKADWRAGRFAAVPDEHDFIPLPEDPRPVRYP